MRKLQRTLFCLIAFTGLCSVVNAQTQSGFSSNNFLTGTKSTQHPKLIKTQGSSKFASVYCALQDKTGNLWFGTTGEGLYCYDGKVFTQFTVHEGLSSNIIWSILEDANGSIWIGTDAGLCRYTKSLGNVGSVQVFPIEINGFNKLPISNKPMIQNVGASAVWSILQDQHGMLWFGTASGVYCYDGKRLSSFLDNKALINPDSLHLKMVDCMLEDSQGIIWFGSGMPPGREGLCRFDGASLQSFRPGGERWIRYLLKEKNGNLMIGCRSQGVWRYDGKQFTPFRKGTNEFGMAGLQDRNGRLWFSGGENSNGFGGNDGIWRYDGNSVTNFATKDGLGDFAVWCFLEDRNGYIWVGTRNVGLYRFDGKRFSTFSE